MNLRKIYMGLLVAGPLLATTSCEKIEDFGDINQNPGATTQPITSALLTNVQVNLGNNLVWDQGGLNTVAGLYSQLFSETQYTESSRYARPTFNFDAYYSGPLYDLQNIINVNSNPETAPQYAAFGSNASQIAIARILKAQYFKFLTDAYGDIPYSEALQGTGLPAYDNQRDIYLNIIKELKEAVDQFDNGATVQGDIMFAGNVAAWKRYANSLRLLAALQLAKADAATGRTEFNAALSHPAGVIDDNSENGTIRYPGGAYNNPFYQYYNITQRLDYAVSDVVVNQLTSTDDPRINAYVETNGVGFPYGLTRENAVAFTNTGAPYSKVLNANFRNQNTPLVVIGAANIWLARAEAAQRGWTTESVAVTYATGLEQSVRQWGQYDAATFAAFLAKVPLGANPLRQIATQEWLSWFPNGMEAFNVWRRTGFPALTPAAGTTLGAIPRRFPYGPNEYNLNTANVNAAAGRYSAGGQPDAQTGRTFIDPQ